MARSCTEGGGGGGEYSRAFTGGGQKTWYVFSFFPFLLRKVSSLQKATVVAV